MMLQRMKNLNGLSIIFYCLYSVHIRRSSIYTLNTEQRGTHSGFPELQTYDTIQTVPAPGKKNS